MDCRGLSLLELMNTRHPSSIIPGADHNSISHMLIALKGDIESFIQLLILRLSRLCVELDPVEACGVK
jgi:hypothetical protein